VSIANGKSRRFAVKAWSDFQTVDWAANGKVLFVTALTRSGSALLRVDTRGKFNVLWETNGTVRPTSTPFIGGPAAPWAVPSPDGRSFGDLRVEYDSQYVVR